MSDAEWTGVRVGDGASLAACLDGLPPVEASIVRAVHDAAAYIPPEFWRCDSSDATVWSGAVFGALRDLAAQMDPQPEVAAARNFGGDGEFERWDLLWIDRWAPVGGRRVPDRIIMACESEWRLDPGQVLYDFKKLTRVLADHRLLIFDPNSADTKGNPNALRTASPEGQNAAYLAIGIHCADSEAERRMIVDWWRA